jgi:hypothetical protein
MKGSIRHLWENNIKNNSEQKGWEGVDLVFAVEGRAK